MATPGTFSSPAQEASDLTDGNVKDAFEKGHDADCKPTVSAASHTDSDRERDLEKGTESATTAPIEGCLSAPEPADPNIVFWDEPADQDPQNPMNWSAKMKWGNIALLSTLSLITPLASSMFAPGVPEVMREFHSTSQTLATFVVSVYVLGFAVGPLFVAPLSEIYGRMPIYQVSNVLFIIFTIACAVSTNMGMLIAFRFLMGCVGSTPLTIGGGTIADIMPTERRAGAMAIWAMGPLLGPVAGPVAGGYLVQAAGWRWVYWLITIAAGVFAIAGFLLMRETYAPVLLSRKAARLRKETGNENLRSKLDNGLTPKELMKRAITRPLRMLVGSPIVLLLSTYMAVIYAILYLLFTTFTFVFEEYYGFDSGTVGLTYIGTGAGMIIGLGVIGAASNRIIQQAMARGELLKPEMRIPLKLTLLGAIPIPVGLFIYGWTAQNHVHWAVPLLGTLFVGFGLICLFMCIQTYLVDAFTVHAASAMAANTVLRSTFGAVIPLGGLDMYDALGLGWGNSLLEFVALAMIPIVVVFKKYGESIRTQTKWQVKL
ncbi:membrane transporter [Aulographum hederae CBS 113979]|uniref:Membrane transporter n=1 Tax=Aulographum hederae CBS 113979 TaxID=1176131 RepID=A0A6G1GMX5_9PEZI|nr:membrane transporter [Aulographum hederae CBS 113979]